MTKLSFIIVQWLCLVAAGMIIIQGEGQSLMEKVVRVENDLGDGINLNVHCKSGDSDIGEHDLAKGQYIQWSFNCSWLGTTLFWCSMKWENVQGSFDVFDFKRDFPLCGFKCWWSIRHDAAYFYVETKDVWEKRYVWPK
ncbi:S-protein homolog 3-like [Ziziphus jujuba]|uniref:S-protein homolog n=1 Tax=Ziziphus jujuba TaxID=326968 RepID=A0ABM3ZXG3_ZIZJJ|nr:S-protein homolog 3-like [Ziziphus jujuba]